MIKIYLLTKECTQKGQYDYEPLRFYFSPKKAQRAFRRQCRGIKEGEQKKDWVWQSGDDADGKKICIKEIKLSTDTIPEKIYVSRKTTYIDGQRVSLEIVSLKKEDVSSKETICGEFEKSWLEPACFLVTFLLLPSLYIASIVYPVAAVYMFAVWGAFMAYTIGYVFYLLQNHYVEKKVSYALCRSESVR